MLPAFVLTTDDFETLIESTVFAGMLRLVLVPVVVTRLALFVALILDLERLLDKVFLTALTLTEGIPGLGSIFPEAQPKGIYIISRECHIIYPV